jgi:HSP20 family protein
MMAEETTALEKQELETPLGIERTRGTRTFAPPADIYETENSVCLLADMPGVEQGDVDIMLEKNLLTIRGKVTETVPDNHELLYAEYSVGDYERTFALSDEVSRDNIVATLKNGVLRLTLPKAEEAKARKIAVLAEE